MSTPPSLLTQLALVHLKPLFAECNRKKALVGVSGGPDSVFLLNVLRTSGYFKELIVAHVNYGLRGNESDGDAVFVEALANELGYPCEVLVDHALKDVDPAQVSGLESKAREIRYAFFQRLGQKLGINAVFVGHTQSDQVETILMNFIRGAGAQGLSGMQAKSTQQPDPTHPPIKVLRPLLMLGKPDIEADLKTSDIRFRIDSTNYDLDFRRNKLRHEIIPRLLEINPSLHETLERTRQLLTQEREDQKIRVDQLLQTETLFRQKSKIEYWLNQSELLKYATSDKRALILRLLKTLAVDPSALGFDHVQATLDLAHSDKKTGRVSLPGGAEAEKTKDTLILRKTKKTTKSKAKALPKKRVLACPGQVIWPTGNIIATRIHSAKEVSTIKQQLLLEKAYPPPTKTYLDADQVDTITVRVRAEGDRMHPLGLDGSKKIQDLFVDAKLSLAERAVYPLLVDGEDILWVPGLAVSEQAKVTLETETIVQLDYIPPPTTKKGS